MAELLQVWGSFVGFSHTPLTWPFALVAMAIAARDRRGWPGWTVFLLILTALVTARTCAVAFHRIAYREWDQANPRTARRPLPAGRISLTRAWILCLVSGAGFVFTGYGINPICLALSPLALALIVLGSLAKRFSDFAHFYRGLAFALSPIGAWLAVTGRLDYPPVILAAIALLWWAGFDIIHTIPDHAFDRQQGLHSLVVRWGVPNALIFAFLIHLVMWGLLLGFGLLLRFRMAYLTGLLIILVCLVLEHWLARRRSLKWLDVAFFRLNALISVIFLVVTIAEVVFTGFRWVR